LNKRNSDKSFTKSRSYIYRDPIYLRYWWP